MANRLSLEEEAQLLQDHTGQRVARRRTMPLAMFSTAFVALTTEVLVEFIATASQPLEMHPRRAER